MGGRMMVKMSNLCPYICNNKTEYGYCHTTGCINPKYAGYAGHCEINAQRSVKENYMHWIWEKPSDDCRCSSCGRIVDQRYPYCPWCGKKAIEVKE